MVTVVTRTRLSVTCMHITSLFMQVSCLCSRSPSQKQNMLSKPKCHFSHLTVSFQALKLHAKKIHVLF